MELPLRLSFRARPLPALLALLLLLAAGCREDPVGGSPDTDAVAYNPDWTAASHGEGAPAYGTVLPQDAVETLEIRMTAAQWARVRADMRALWGFDFGGGGAGGGGFPEGEPAYIPVNVRFRGKQWRDVGWRLKGNSTLRTAWQQGNYKLPFRLNFDRFEDSIPAIRNQRFFGFDELSFSSGRGDPSLIREKVTADIFRMAGIPAARTALYRVFIDFGEGLRYCGLYGAVEVIDDTMLDDQFGSSTGNLYKPESAFRSFDINQFEKQNNVAQLDWSDVQAAIAALNSPLRTTDPAAWRAGLEAVFDVDHFLKWLAVNTAMVNWDVYGTIAHNYYLYHHPSRGLVWIPWDHNEALTGSPGITGVIGGPPGSSRAASLTLNEVGQNWPLIRYTIDDPVYAARYRVHMRDFRDRVFTTEAMTALFTKYHALAAPHAIGPGGEQPGATYLANSTAFTQALPALIAHVQARRDLLATFLP